MKKIMALPAILIIASFAMSLYFYSQMPDTMAFHWDSSGKPDGYSGKNTGLFFIPGLASVLFAFFIAIPRIDPKKNNIEKSGKYHILVSAITAFLLYIHALVISWNIGFQFSMVQALVPGFGALFWVIGYAIENIRPNWFMGIRTPWTLSSKSVWFKTHKRGGKLFKFCGIISLAGMAIQQYAILLVIVPVVVSAAYLIVYSYMEYNRTH